MYKRDLFQLIHNHMEYCINQLSKIDFITDIPVYAILLNKNFKIIDETYNQNNLHAEEILINRNNCKNLNLITTLEPCPACAFKVYTSGIKNIYFGALNIQYGALGGKFNLIKNITNARKLNIYGGILEKRNISLLLKFFKKIRKF